jgi:hypothetical protein
MRLPSVVQRPESIVTATATATAEVRGADDGVWEAVVGSGHRPVASRVHRAQVRIHVHVHVVVVVVVG